MTRSFNIGKFRMAVNIGRRRGRPPKQLSIQARELFQFYKRIFTNQRLGGHPFSRVLRRVFESKKTRRVVGINLTATTILFGLILSPASTFSLEPKSELAITEPSEIDLTTEASTRIPTENFEITQGYHLFHRAVDLNGDLGDPIFPLMDGVVETVVYGRFGYGNSVVIDHGSGFKSLYAHLSKITVEEGQEVNKNSVIGTMGSTGWSTGTHLHLEIWDHGVPINPIPILK